MRIVNLRDSHKYYKKNEANREDVVDVKVYMEIVLGFLKFLMVKLFEGHDIKLPCELGILGVRGRKQVPRLDEEGNIVGLPPDWAETKKLWASNEQARLDKKLVYHFNEHSANFRYKIVWFKKGYKFRNKRLYSIKFSRKNKRTISVMIKQGKEYTEGKYSRKNS